MAMCMCNALQFFFHCTSRTSICSCVVVHLFVFFFFSSLFNCAVAVDFAAQLSFLTRTLSRAAIELSARARVLVQAVFSFWSVYDFYICEVVGPSPLCRLIECTYYISFSWDFYECAALFYCHFNTLLLRL